MEILDGKMVSGAIKEELKQKVSKLKTEYNIIPHLAAILVGNDGASETYVASKIRNCEEIGFRSTLVRFDVSCSAEELKAEIKKLNTDPAVDGILIQLPLPKQINVEEIINLVDPSKDVDGFNPANIGNMVLGFPTFIPATPFGILLMLKHYNIETQGKHTAVIGRSNIVGRPISILMSQQTYPGNSTVTLCHSKTKNLRQICLNADIIIAALGKPLFLTADMVNPGSVVIDVGITRVPDTSKKSGFAIKGDVDFENVKRKCSYISPVPGGVGLMTIAALLTNTFNACLRKNNLHFDEA